MVVNGNGLSNIIGKWSNFLTVRSIGANRCSSGPSFAGYDLRLSRRFRIPLNMNCGIKGSRARISKDKEYVLPPASPLHPYENYYDIILPDTINELIIPPHSTILAHSVERIVVPSNLIGICLGKSSYARIGLLCNTTPLEPGWSGYLVIELSNLADWDITLRVEEGIAQVIFLKLQEEAHYSGRWQNQEIPQDESQDLPDRQVST